MSAPPAVGVMLNNLERDRILAWEAVARLGFPVVHTNAVAESLLTGPDRRRYVAAARASGVRVHTVFVGYDGQSYADVASVARTVGLLPVPHLREHRVDVAQRYCDLARDLGAAALGMHLGFFPADPQHPDYAWLVGAVRRILGRCGDSGLTLHLETGQESAAELLRLIEAVDRPDLGVNFDPANFLLYGTDEPLAALAALGPYVRGVHCKDGHRPAAPGRLGREAPIGQGDVDFPRYLGALKRLGYAGPLVIERESGPNAEAEILAAREYLLRTWCGKREA